VKSGKITPEEAIHHPQRNIITQAIQGTHRPTESDVELITDVEPGDYFFMCTDGTLENLRDSALESIFSSNSSAVGIKDEMQYACNGKTKDNYSFYIIPIQNVQESAGIKQNILSFFYSLV
jgi:protein phosphatase